MIEGRIASKTDRSLVVLTASGVGYQLLVTSKDLDTPIGESAVFHTHLVVRENLMQLCGFRSAAELDLFELLILVDGVGPKSALSILNLGSVDRLSQAITSGDIAYLSLAAGIGKKSASKIVLELKDKVSSVPVSGLSQSALTTSSEITEALRSLGYAPAQIKQAIEQVDSTQPVEEQIRIALRIIGGAQR